MQKSHKKELVPIETKEGQQLVDYRLLHQFLQVKTKPTQWLQGRVKEYGFRENVDFFSFSQISEKLNVGRPERVWHLTIDMAKELGMLERSARGRQIRQYFIAKEKEAKAAAIKPLLTPDEIVKGLKVFDLNWEVFYEWSDIKKRLEYNGKVSAHEYKKRYPQHFICINNRLKISRFLVGHLAMSRQLVTNRQKIKAMEGALPLGFGMGVQSQLF